MLVQRRRHAQAELVEQDFPLGARAARAAHCQRGRVGGAAPGRVLVAPAAAATLGAAAAPPDLQPQAPPLGAPVGRQRHSAGAELDAPPAAKLNEL